MIDVHAHYVPPGYRAALLDNGHAQPDGVAEWLATIGGTVVAVAGTAANLAAWFNAHDVGWALQRPDFHLFGTATDSAGAAALLAKLRAQLA